MPLPDARAGESFGLHIYPRMGEEFTVADPEKIIWSSIYHLSSRGVAEWMAEHRHGITTKRERTWLARNLKLYIQHAAEFYDAAGSGKPNTAPLFYYYSFLNLAKALCELRRPNLHGRTECYSHGLSWRPDPQKMADPNKEYVTVARRGMWHALWECTVRLPCTVANGTRLPVELLFSYCPEVSSEYRVTFGGLMRLVDLNSPDLLYDESRREAWLRFSVDREDLRIRQLYAPRLITAIRTTRSSYVEVQPKEKKFRTFQSSVPKRPTGRESPWSALEADVRGLNLFAHLGERRKMIYSFPFQTSLPIRIPQLLSYYTILFWLGSLVRYDPHSVRWLMDSPYWMMIDGFVSQSRLWLLELFRWAFYQTEISLLSAR